MVGVCKHVYFVQVGKLHFLLVDSVLINYLSFLLWYNLIIIAEEDKYFTRKPVILLPTSEEKLCYYLMANALVASDFQN